EDVLVALRVDLVNHGRERRRLAGAGGTRDEHETAWTVGEVRQHLWQSKLVKPLDLLRDHAVDRRDRAALVEHVAAEARDAADAEREVQFERFLEPLLLQIG